LAVELDGSRGGRVVVDDYGVELIAVAIQVGDEGAIGGEEGEG